MIGQVDYNHRYISIIPENRGKHEKLALNSNSACSIASSGGNMYSWTYTCHENTSIYGNNTCSEHALGDMFASETSISLNDSNNDLNNDLNINLINFNNNNNSFTSNLDTTIDNCMPDILHAYTGESPSSSSYDLDYDVGNTMFNRLSEIRSHNTNKIIIAELNINSIRNKFEQLVENIDKNVDILLIVETKLDDSFPINQFYIGYQQFISDRSSHGGGLILYVRDNIPTKQRKQFCIHDDIEAIAIEIYLWKWKWLICGSYNPQEKKIIHHLDHVGKLIDFYLNMYENIILLGDYNCEEMHSAMEEFLHTFNLKNLVKNQRVIKVSTTLVPLT